MNINYFGPLILSQLFLGKLNTSYDKIINFCFLDRSLTKKGFFGYQTTKDSLSRLTKSFSIKLGFRIRVNALDQAVIKKEMLKQELEDSFKIDKLLSFYPKFWIGELQGINQVFLFLKVPPNKFSNGSIIKVSEGIQNYLNDSDL